MNTKQNDSVTHAAAPAEEAEAAAGSPSRAAVYGRSELDQVICVVYIRSIGHSGSTLLDMLISAHDDVMSVGSLKNWSKKQHKRCTCSATTVAECPFWRAVEAHLQEHENLSFSELDMESADPDVFRRHNRAMFRAVQQVSGKPVIVDSSKSVDRLLRLLAVNDFDIRIIQLERHPFGIVFSNIKKGRDYCKRARKIARSYVHSRLCLAPYKRLHVRYETLARQPKQSLQQIMKFIGLPFQESQLQWAGRVRHNIGGNRMRESTDSTIRLDTAWRRALSKRQKLLIALNLGIAVMSQPRRFVRSLHSMRNSQCRRLEMIDT